MPAGRGMIWARAELRCRRSYGRGRGTSLGTRTPTKIASYGLCVAGLLLLLAGRVVEAVQGSFWAGVALLLLALSCFVDSLLPGGSELSDEQATMIRHMGIPYREGADKIASIILGVLLLIGGLYLIS